MIIRHFRERVENSTILRQFADESHEVKGLDQWGRGTPRNIACLAINQMCLDRSIQDAESADETGRGEGSMMLVSIEAEEGWRHVALSSVFPRVYSLLEGPGWDVIPKEGIFYG